MERKEKIESLHEKVDALDGKILSLYLSRPFTLSFVKLSLLAVPSNLRL
jgi:hypothetical protein